MAGDKLVISIEGRRYALDTSAVASIVEVGHIPFIPGRTGFVKGIISLRGEPVTVVDLKAALGLNPEGTGGLKKIIVLREKNRSIGLEIGSAEVSFAWKEELSGELLPGGGKFIKGSFDFAGGAVAVIDWAALFYEAARVLSSDGTGI